MNKNIILTILCLCSIQSLRAPFIEQYLLPGIFYFDFGFNLGVKPYMWSFIPFYALGNGLKYIPQENKAAAYLLGAVGCLTGTLAICSAITYGVKTVKTLCQNNTKTNADLEPTNPLETPVDKTTQDKKHTSELSKKKFPYYSYVQST